MLHLARLSSLLSQLISDELGDLHNINVLTPLLVRLPPGSNSTVATSVHFCDLISVESFPRFQFNFTANTSVS
ncbi:hypothetical protein E2C01_066829 [Portunus trituberculatus]|uniref:Uncharacterized protein n=1 Tax=Portunus trituberculatus TaxID=210409 RepID=A0A5B7HRY3_PORTR|nr:hypothetical protein [Portunus trituberculatus]